MTTSVTLKSVVVDTNSVTVKRSSGSEIAFTVSTSLQSTGPVCVSISDLRAALDELYPVKHPEEGIWLHTYLTDLERRVKSLEANVRDHENAFGNIANAVLGSIDGQD